MRQTGGPGSCDPWEVLGHPCHPSGRQSRGVQVVAEAKDSKIDVNESPEAL